MQVVDPLSGDTYWVEYRTASGRDVMSAEFRGATPRCSSLDATLVRCALNGDRAVGGEDDRTHGGVRARGPEDGGAQLAGAGHGAGLARPGDGGALGLGHPDITAAACARSAAIAFAGSSAP